VVHVFTECEKLAQEEYKKRQNSVASITRKELCKIYSLRKDNPAESILENDSMKILWNFNIYTDRIVEARRPDTVVVDKRNAETTIIDIAIPGDH